MKANERQVGGRHYKTSYEHWDLVIAIPLSYLAGCSTKYVARWRKKGGVEDLEKALHYLDKLIESRNKPLPKYLTPSEIKIEVHNYSVANLLFRDEYRFIELLCLYDNLQSLLEARELLREIIARANTESYTPGTPEDGGHHGEP